MLIDSWTNQQSWHTNSIALTGTNKYDLVMEYFDATQIALAKLFWSNATTVGFSPVPTLQLYPAAAPVPAVTLTSPANNSTNLAGTIAYAASVTTNNNVIQSVGFYRNGTIVANSQYAPFSASENNVPPGSNYVYAILSYQTNWTVYSATNVLYVVPAAPTAGNNGPLCAGSTLNLTASTVSGATYAWTGPSGFTSTQQNPSISNAQVANSGTYSVTATVNGQTSAAGTTVVTVNAIPPAPTASNNGPITAGATLNLYASTVAGATYAWTGPNGFSSSAQNPSISNAQVANSGTYSVTATVNGCASAAGTTIATVNAAVSQSSVTISNVVNNLNGSLTINYGGGAGTQFILVQSQDLNRTRDSWTPIKTNSATPGSFTLTGGDVSFIDPTNWYFSILSK